MKIIYLYILWINIYIFRDTIIIFINNNEYYKKKIYYHKQKYKLDVVIIIKEKYSLEIFLNILKLIGIYCLSISY